MPIYEYNCLRCGETFEVRQKFSDEPVVVHEGCGGEVEKLISRSSLHFKGSGWYVNDYGRGKSARDTNGKKPEAKTESKSDSKGESKSDSKSESKPESKSDSKPAPKSESKTETKPAKP
ncbi:MAG: zinc ribbon domain-containing protein [Acidobacteriia bacterium]|nr:zinc ribbon domain-containing protein [Terriglobia bacterium]